MSQKQEASSLPDLEMVNEEVSGVRLKNVCKILLISQVFSCTRSKKRPLVEEESDIQKIARLRPFGCWEAKFRANASEAVR